MANVDNYFKEEAAIKIAIQGLQQVGLLGEDLEEPPMSEEAIQFKKMFKLLHENYTKEFREKVVYHFGLPADAEMNRILRYEANIQRQLAQAINQLERLQRARKGEHVPAPMTLQVSTDH